MPDWTTDWQLILDYAIYIVCPINERADGTYYLGKPLGFYAGWQVKRLMEGCYAAVVTPEFKRTRSAAPAQPTVGTE